MSTTLTHYVLSLPLITFWLPSGLTLAPFSLLFIGSVCSSAGSRSCVFYMTYLCLTAGVSDRTSPSHGSRKGALAPKCTPWLQNVSRGHQIDSPGLPNECPGLQNDTPGIQDGSPPAPKCILGAPRWKPGAKSPGDLGKSPGDLGLLASDQGASVAICTNL